MFTAPTMRARLAFGAHTWTAEKAGTTKTPPMRAMAESQWRAAKQPVAQRMPLHRAFGADLEPADQEANVKGDGSDNETGNGRRQKHDATGRQKRTKP